MRRHAGPDLLWLAGLLALPLAAGLLRPLLPVDETRYAAVAWEMWQRGDLLVPRLNGVPYHHKPPLLFWLMHAGWAIFGVNTWWPRLISPLFAAGTLALLVPLGRLLWPDRPGPARMAPFILVGSLLYGYFASALMFDALLAFFVVLGLWGIVSAWRRGRGRGFGWLLLGLAGALYAKGPVALVHLLPAALLAPWWMREQRPPWRHWYLGVLAALAGSAVLMLAWAIPAGLAGGAAYRQAIFWGQSAGRMVDSFAHREPWWFHLAWLPLNLAPWLLWPRWWKGLDRAALAESGTRLLLLVLLVALLFFSAISGKRTHYLLPEFALFALLCARGLGEGGSGRRALIVPAATLAAFGATALLAAPWLAKRLAGLEDTAALYVGGAVTLACAGVLLALRSAAAPVEVRRIATASVVAFSALMIAGEVAMHEPYDVVTVGRMLAQFEREGRPVAVEGGHHGQWTFAGRLSRPPEEVDDDQVAAWLASHPRGRVVFVHRQAAEIPAAAVVLMTRRYRGAWLSILASPGEAEPGAPRLPG